MTGCIVVVGSINRDDSIRMVQLPKPGETVSGISVETALGGKGANQAVAAARAGANVRMVGAVGQDGDQELSALVSESIDTGGVARLSDTPTGRAIVLVDAAAENSIVVLAGANHHIPDDVIVELGSSLQAGDIVLLQHEISSSTSRVAARVARAAGATVIWNAAPAPTSRDELITDLDLLVVNEHELAAVATLLDLGLSSQGDIDVLLAAVAGLLEVDVVCTLGAAGAIYIVDGKQGRAPARVVDAVDTTAAGDTFVGYLAATVGLPFRRRLEVALTAGSLTVTRPGASQSIPTRAEIDSILGADEMSPT